MNADKIIQIIPAQSDIWARHIGVDNGEPYESLCRVVCFALMEDPRNQYRYVRPMSLTHGDGFVDFADDSDDFTDIVYRQINGEVCDCREKKAAQGAANTQDGETEHVDHAVSASIINETEEKVK